MSVIERWPVEAIDAIADAMPGRDRDAVLNLMAQAMRAVLDAGFLVVPAADYRGAVSAVADLIEAGDVLSRRFYHRSSERQTWQEARDRARAIGGQ